MWCGGGLRAETLTTDTWLAEKVVCARYTIVEGHRDSRKRRRHRTMDNVTKGKGDDGCCAYFKGGPALRTPNSESFWRRSSVDSRNFKCSVWFLSLFPVFPTFCERNTTNKKIEACLLSFGFHFSCFLFSEFCKGKVKRRNKILLFSLFYFIFSQNPQNRKQKEKKVETKKVPVFIFNFYYFLHKILKIGNIGPENRN